MKDSRAAPIDGMKIPMYRFVITLLLLSVIYGAHAENAVYKWVDKDGKLHYSTSPNERHAAPASLPPIQRGGSKYPKVVITSCDGHGGIDCARGADNDGSVICYDEYRDASQRFNMLCTTTKLEVVSMDFDTNPLTFVVLVRNKKPVAAQEVRVMLKRRTERTAVLVGPSSIAPHGSAEYVFSSQNPHEFEFGKPTVGNIDVTCKNC